jgi:hypothetical protein
MLVAASSYYIISTAPQPERMVTRQYTMFVRTIASDSGTYTVRLPLVVPSNDTPFPIPENDMLLETLNHGHGEIISTEHGYAFEVEANQSFYARMSFTRRVAFSSPLDSYKLSMCVERCGVDNQTFHYHGYMQSANVTDLRVDEELTITTEGLYYYGESASFSCDGWLSGGWQFLDGEYTLIPAPIP